MTRRTFLRRTAILARSGTLAASGCLGYAYFAERRWLRHERIEVGVRHLPAGMDGYRIVQLTDIHHERFMPDGTLAAMVEQANALNPDALALTGDFVTASSGGIERLARFLAELRARDGVFGCFGNHDVWNGRRAIGAALAKAGVQMLVDDARRIGGPGGSLLMAGLDSAWAGRPRLRQALVDRRTREPVVLLMHEPDYFDFVAPTGQVALQLSGHTHGGQVALPFWGAIHLPRWGKKYERGHFERDGSQLYVSRGVGCTGLPFRFASRPEITEIVLRST